MGKASLELLARLSLAPAMSISHLSSDVRCRISGCLSLLSIEGGDCGVSEISTVSSLGETICGELSNRLRTLGLVVPRSTWREQRLLPSRTSASNFELKVISEESKSAELPPSKESKMLLLDSACEIFGQRDNTAAHVGLSSNQVFDLASGVFHRYLI